MTAGRDRLARSWTLFVALLVVANTLQLLYFAAFTTWPLWRWYYYYLPVLFLFSLALILKGCFLMLPELRRWAGHRRSDDSLCCYRPTSPEESC